MPKASIKSRAQASCRHARTRTNQGTNAMQCEAWHRAMLCVCCYEQQHQPMLLCTGAVDVGALCNRLSSPHHCCACAPWAYRWWVWHRQGSARGPLWGCSPTPHQQKQRDHEVQHHQPQDQVQLREHGSSLPAPTCSGALRSAPVALACRPVVRPLLRSARDLCPHEPALAFALELPASVLALSARHLILRSQRYRAV